MNDEKWKVVNGNIEFDHFKFTSRTKSVLKKHNIKTLKELTDLSAEHLKRMTGFTSFVIKDIRKKLAVHNISLFGDILGSSLVNTVMTMQIPEIIYKIINSIIDINCKISEIIFKIKNLDIKND